MDGRLAVAFWLASLLEGTWQGEGVSVARVDAGDRLTLSTGAVQFEGAFTGWEQRVTWNMPAAMGRFTPTLDVSLTDKGGFWAGVGLYQEFGISTGQTELFVGLTFAPGLYFPGNDVDLGLPLEFRSGVELGVVTEAGWRVSVSYDHRSNGDLAAVNPGLETLQVRFSRPLGPRPQAAR